MVAKDCSRPFQLVSSKGRAKILTAAMLMMVTTKGWLHKSALVEYFLPGRNPEQCREMNSKYYPEFEYPIRARVKHDPLVWDTITAIRLPSSSWILRDSFLISQKKKRGTIWCRIFTGLVYTKKMIHLSFPRREISTTISSISVDSCEPW